MLKEFVRSARLREAMSGYAFLLPLLVVMGLFVFYPLATTVRLSFHDYSFIRDELAFVGIGNYSAWFNDPAVWETLWISAMFFFLYVPANVGLALVLALLIDRVANRYMGTIYRTIFYFPVVLPAAIVFHMWVWIYDPSIGFFSLTGQALGFERALNWLGDPSLALGGLALMSVWRLVGETVIIFLVGLANIPNDLYEAGRIDGGSELDIIRRIVLPLLKPVIFLVLVLRVQVLGLIQEPLFMTEGGPARATRTYGLNAFFTFYREDSVGYANTQFVMLGIISILVVLVAWLVLRPQRH